MPVKLPPAYRVPPRSASARTWLFALGSQAVTSPVVTSSAAMLFRVCPPMPLKRPPAYTVPPLTARAETVP